MNRSAGLDALRAAACAMVVAFHLHTVAGVSFGPLDVFVGGGEVGVYVFFALSGYLLYRPFIDRPVDLGGYAIKRAARILPGYYVALICLTILTGSRLAVDHPLPFLAIGASYSIPLRGFMGSAWTLSAELLFYVTLPLIARAAAGRELRVLAVLGAVSVVAGVAERLTLSSSTEWLVGVYPVVFYAFVPGMLLAVVELRGPEAFRRLAAGRWLVVGLLFILLGTLAHLSPVAFGPTIGAAIAMGWLIQHPVPGARTLVFLGGMSYALYLWHKDLLLAFGPAGLLLALVGAAASWWIVERPILGWAHSFARARLERRSVGDLAPTTAG